MTLRELVNVALASARCFRYIADLARDVRREEDRGWAELTERWEPVIVEAVVQLTRERLIEQGSAIGEGAL